MQNEHIFLKRDIKGEKLLAGMVFLRERTGKGAFCMLAGWSQNTHGWDGLEVA